MADALPLADKQLAAMLVTRDANTLALSLETLTGKGVAQYVFGIGVLGMAVSTIIILMLINGFCLTEMLGVPAGGVVHRIGALLPGLTGSLGFLFLWSKGANFWLAVPTSMFGMVLLPIAYITFFLMMNNRALLGGARLRGGRQLAMNAVMLVALTAATIGAGWSIWSQTRPVPGTAVPMRWVGIAIVSAIALAALFVHLMRSGRATNRG